jgi:hypothetical protein
MSGPLDDLADKWFTLCDSENQDQIFASLALRAQVRLEEAGGVDSRATKDTLDSMPRDTLIARHVFVRTVNEVVASSGKEAEVGKALQEMIADIQLLGPPPPETGSCFLCSLAIFMKTRPHPCACTGFSLSACMVLTVCAPLCLVLLSTTGDTVKDIHAYRTYHGLDKALGYLLQTLITTEPSDPGAKNSCAACSGLSGSCVLTSAVRIF